MTPHQHTIAPEALRPRVEGDFANDRVKHDIMARLFGDPAPAAKIGRFTVIRELGRGGTGVVYAAYDEQLERKVAVKLLHADAADLDARARLLREAQAMARLSHPHIVSVHEVGTHNRQIYIAMEFVHGVTLGTWLKSQVRTWREVVEMFRQAGAGLAAAHEAGLVHRDFKPANVMVGDDGRVRVLDFGLARADGDPEVFADIERTRDPATEVRALDTSLTLTGSLIGTPAFMAPEQFRGETADPRSDQFALCVALYEALFHERPFAGETLHTLMHSVLVGEVREPTCPVKLPRALKAAILRGLQLRREARHPSMDALLAAIDRVVEPRRRSWLVAAGVAAGFAVALGGLALETNAQGHVCKDRGAAEIAKVWSPERAREIGAALRAADPYADDAWARAQGRFDAYAEAWRREVVEVCTSGELRREQSQARSQQRMACLDDRLRAFEAALELFDHPEPVLAVRSPDIAAGLQPLDTCADPNEHALAITVNGTHGTDAATDADGATVAVGATDATDEAELRAEVAELRAGLARADALRRATMNDDAMRGLDGLRPRVVDRHPQLLAELELSRGRLLTTIGRHRDALQALQRAYFTALTARAERLAITAAIELLRLNADALADYEAAIRWERHAQALLTHGGGPALRADLASAQGERNFHTGRMVEAQADFRRAFALYAEAGRADTAEAAVVQRNLADATAKVGGLDEAEAQLSQAMTVLRREYCDRHPDLIAAINSEGELALARGDLGGALASFERGRSNLAGIAAEDSLIHLRLTSNAAQVHVRRGELDTAEAMVRHSLEAVARRGLGLALDARALLPEVFTLRLLMIALHHRRERLADAEAEARSLVADAERAWGPEEPYVSSAIEALARTLLLAGRVAEARPLAERAYKLADGGGVRVSNELRYNSAFTLARVLAAAGEPNRADKLARDAQRLAETVGDARVATDVARWLGEHPAG